MKRKPKLLKNKKVVPLFKAPPKQGGTKKGSVYCGGGPKLSPSKRIILNLITKQGYDVSQIASRRGCSKRYVRQIIKELRENGYISKMVPPPPLGLGTTGTTTEVRLHAQKFKVSLIKPIPQNYYKEHLGSVIRIDGNTIQCHKEVIYIQARDKEFYGDTEEEALSLSMDYWYKFFSRLENDLGLKIVKDRKQNITQVYAEWASGPCDMAKDCEKRGSRVRIYADDGKLRYTTDHSLMYEREAHHSITGMEDSELINRYLKDVLNHPQMPLPSEYMKLMYIHAKETRELSAGLGVLVNLLGGNNNNKNQANNKTDVCPEYIG